jgi:hypothetical protein
VGKKRLTPIARRLRTNQTEAEERLWHHLRARRLEGEKFVRQLQIDRYVADVACRTARVAVELDGGQHDAERDAARTSIIETHGYWASASGTTTYSPTPTRCWKPSATNSSSPETARDEPSPLGGAYHLNPLPLGRGQGEGVRRWKPSSNSEPLTPALSPLGRGGRTCAHDGREEMPVRRCIIDGRRRASAECDRTEIGRHGDGAPDLHFREHLAPHLLVSRLPARTLELVQRLYAFEAAVASTDAAFRCSCRPDCECVYRTPAR